MRALKMLCVILLIAGCATAHQSPKLNLADGRWQRTNTQKQKACVLKIIEIAPPTATAEELDFNLKLCMLRNGLFI